MLGKSKFIVACCALALIPMLVAFVPQGVQAKDERPKEPFREVSRWNFAKLQYSNAVGQIIEIQASTITKLWLVHTGDGDLRLEILYENGDYSMVNPRNFHLIRRSQGIAEVDVPIVRTSLAGMAFPNLANK